MLSFLAVLFLSLTAVLSHQSHQSHQILFDKEQSPKRVHECVHDKLEKKFRKQYISYSNHPFELIKNKAINDAMTRRKLVEDADYSLIRITPYYDTTITSSLTTEQLNYVKELVSASIRYLESFISVIPIDGPLFISSCESWSDTDDFVYPFCQSSDITQMCGPASIPDEHLAETWVFDSHTSQKSTLQNEAGSGRKIK